MDDMCSVELKCQILYAVLFLIFALTCVSSLCEKNVHKTTSYTAKEFLLKSLREKNDLEWLLPVCFIPV